MNGTGLSGRSQRCALCFDTRRMETSVDSDREDRNGLGRERADMFPLGMQRISLTTLRPRQFLLFEALLRDIHNNGFQIVP